MKRLALALVVCLLTLGGSAWGMEKWQGYCQNGGQKVSIPGLGQSTTKWMQSYPGCTMTVYDSGTSNLSTIYSDDGVTPKANPFTADSITGLGFFYAADGTYDVKLSGTGISAPFTLSGFTLSDPISPTTSNPAVVNSIRFANDHFCAVAGVYDQTCINNAIAASEVGGTVIIPYANWLLTGTINVTKAVNIECSLGWSNTIRVASSVSASTDVVHVYGATIPIEGGGLSNCQFLPQSGTPARYAVNIDTTTYGISKFKIDHNYFGNFGSYGIKSTNPALTDGWFTSWVTNNVIYNGVNLDRVGDNVIIKENVITGANIGLDATQVQGSTGFVFDNNNVTTTGACVHLGDGFTHPEITNNQCEGSVSVTGSNSAYIDIDGTVGWPVEHAIIENNSKIAGVASGITGLRLNYTNQPIVDGNRFYRAGGGAYDILVTANTNSGSAYIGDKNRYDQADSQSVIISDSAASLIKWPNPWSQTSQGGKSGGLDISRTLYTPYLYVNSIANTRYADQFTNGSSMGGIDLAYADGPSTGVHLVLAKDITISSAQTLTLTIGKPLWLDLNGRKITCTNTSGICLKIQKPDATPRYPLEIYSGTIAYSGSSASITGLSIGNGNIAATTNCTVRSMTFNGFNTSGSVGLDLNNAEDCNVVWSNFNQNTVGLQIQQDSNNNRYDHNRFQANVTNVKLTDSMGQTFDDNLFQASTGTHAVEIFQTAVRNVYNVQFRGNWFELNGDSTANARQIYVSGAGGGNGVRYLLFENNFFATDTPGGSGAIYEFTGAGTTTGNTNIIFRNNSYSIASSTVIANPSATQNYFAQNETQPDGVNVGINIYSYSDITPVGLFFAPPNAAKKFQLFPGDIGLLDGSLNLRDLSAGGYVWRSFGSTGAYEFYHAGGTKFENGGVVAGYSDAGTTNMWSISNVTGLATLTGVTTGGTQTVNRAVCWKTATQLGSCSTVVAADGSCTCN